VIYGRHPAADAGAAAAAARSIAFAHTCSDSSQQLTTPGDAVSLTVVDRATRPPGPAAGPRPLTTVHQPVDQPEPVQRGALRVATPGPLVEGTLEQGEVVFVTPGEVRRAAGSLEILRRQGRLPVGHAQQLIGRAPGLPPERLATLLKR